MLPWFDSYTFFIGLAVAVLGALASMFIGQFMVAAEREREKQES